MLKKITSISLSVLLVIGLWPAAAFGQVSPTGLVAQSEDAIENQQGSSSSPAVQGEPSSSSTGSRITPNLAPAGSGAFSSWQLLEAADDLAFEYDEATGTLTVSGTGAMPKWLYKEKDRPWAEYAASARKLVVAEGVTTVGESAFSGFAALEEATLPDSLCEIGGFAFNNCSSLSRVELSGNLVEIGGYAFSQCGKLDKVTLPEKVKKIGDHAFDGCGSLSAIVLPESLVEIGPTAFGGCGALAEMSLPSSLETLGESAFWSCTSLTSVSVPEQVKRLEHRTFGQCKALEEAALPEGLGEIGSEAFLNCVRLESIDLPDSVSTLASGAFNGCGALKSVTLPKNCKTCAGAFSSGCGSLMTATIPDGMTVLPDRAFDGARALVEVSFPPTLTKVGAKAFQNCESLVFVDLPESTVEIGEEAFMGCGSLSGISCLARTLSIGARSFKGCGELYSFSESTEAVNRPAAGGGSALRTLSQGNSALAIGDSAFDGAPLKYVYHRVKEAELDISVEEGNDSYRTAQQVYEAPVSFSQPDRIVSSHYEKPADGLFEDFYGGIAGPVANHQAVKLDDVYFGMGSAGMFASLPRDSHITFGFDKAMRLRDGSKVYLCSTGNDNERASVFVMTQKGRMVYCDSVQETPYGWRGLGEKTGRRYLVEIPDLEDDLVIGVKVVGLDLGGDSPGFDLVDVALLAERTDTDSRFDFTAVTMLRGDEAHDLVSGEKQVFEAGSDEVASIVVEPDWGASEPGMVALVQFSQDPDAVMQNAGGSFMEISPGQSFLPGDSVYVILYDASGKEVKRVRIALAISGESSGDAVIDAVANALPDYSNLGSDKLYGPRIKIGKLDFNLFECEIGLNLPGVFDKNSITYEYDPEEDKYRVLLGHVIAEDETDVDRAELYKTAINLTKADSLSDRRQVFNDLLKHDGGFLKVPGKPLFDGNVTFAGFLEMRLNEDGSMSVIDGGIAFLFEATMTIDWRLPPPAAIVTGRFAVEGELEANAKLAIQDWSSIDFSSEIVGTVTPKVSFGANAVAFDLRGGVGGELEGKLDLPCESLRDSANIGLSGFIFVEANTIVPGLSGEWRKNLPKKLELYPELQVVDSDPDGSSSSPSAELSFAKSQSIGPLDMVATAVSHPQALTATVGSPFDSQCYREAKPRMATLDDGRKVLVYLDDTVQGHEGVGKLVYRIESGGTWSAAAPVDDSSQVDMAGSLLLTSKGDLYVLYQASEKPIDEGAGSSVASQFDMRVARLGARGFEEVSRLADPGVTRYGCSIAESDGQLNAFWAENSEGDILLTSGETKFVKRSCVDGAWGTPQAIGSCDEPVPEFSAGRLRGMLHVAYVLDGRIYLDGNLLETSTWGAQAGSVKFVDDMLYFRVDGKLLQYDGSVVSELGITCSSDYEIAGRSVYWTQQDNFTSELYCAEAYSGKRAVALTRDAGYISSFDVASGGTSGDEVVYSSQVVDQNAIAQCKNPYGLTVLKSASSFTRRSAAILDPAYDVAALSPGEACKVMVAVANTGTEDLHGVTIQASMGDSVVGSSEPLELLESGERASVSLEASIPEQFEGATMTFAIAADEELICDSSDSLEIAAPRDLSVAIDDETVVVSNASRSIASEVVVSIRSGYSQGALVREERVGDLQPGASVRIALEKADWLAAASDRQETAKHLFVEASQRDGELLLWNNSATASKEFIDIGEAYVSDFSECRYDGTPQCPSFTVMCDDAELSKGVDYEIAYSRNTNAGSAVVTLDGIGLYRGTLEAYYTIEPALIDDEAISGVLSPTSFVYNGTARKPTVALVGAAGSALKAGTDYRVEYKNNVNAGKAQAIVVGMGNYSGKMPLSFTVKKLPVSRASISGGVYSGKPVAPKVKVGSVALKSGIDYTIAYKASSGKSVAAKNVKPVGFYKAIVKGKGNCEGSAALTFTVNPKGTSLKKVTPASRAVALSWKKQAQQTSGYQVQCSLKRDFKTVARSVVVKKPGSTSTTLAKLKPKTKYYVRIRTFKIVGKKELYSSWSGVKAATTKK